MIYEHLPAILFLSFLYGHYTPVLSVYCGIVSKPQNRPVTARKAIVVYLHPQTLNAVLVHLFDCKNTRYSYIIQTFSSKMFIIVILFIYIHYFMDIYIYYKN